MSIEKNMNTRIQHKHDSEANWEKAINFIPKKGELIVYDIDENYIYSRVKIGDGISTANELPFIIAVDTSLTQSGQAADAKAVGDALEGKQPIGDYVLANKLPEVIDDALTQAKESGEFDGADAPQEAVLFVEQTLTEDQQAQARENIAVPAISDVFEYTNNPTFTNMFDTVEIEYRKLININDMTIEDTTANIATTGYIPVAAGSIVRVNEDFPISATGTPSFMLYDSSKTPIRALRTSSIVDGAYFVERVATDANGYITAFKINKPAASAYIRIANDSRLVGRNPVLTVDEEITYEMGYGDKLNSNVKVEYSQVINAPQKNCWSILPYERLNIAYSSIGRKPINTVEHFTDAAENCGYNVLKCDVRPTSDGELVCCHDAGFTFNSSGKITTYDSTNATAIRSVSAETVLSYSFPTGEHPCLVGDYLDICRKYGKVAFVTIRNEYMDVVIPKLLEELHIHNMTYSSIINCMTYESLVQWRQQDQTVMINYTLGAGANITQEQIDRAIGLGYCSLCGFGLTGSTVSTPTNTCDFEYAREKGIRLLQAIAYKEGSPEACYEMGYDGCQIGYAWNPVSQGLDEESVNEMIANAIGTAIGGAY